MSVQITERRYCDVCEIDFDEAIASWMVISVPNAPEGMTPEFDICTWDCLVKWVTTEENPVDEDDSLSQMTDNHTLPKTTPAPDAQAKLDAAMAAMEMKPAMSLADAIASGTLDFTRGPQ